MKRIQDTVNRVASGPAAKRGLSKIRVMDSGGAVGSSSFGSKEGLNDAENDFMNAAENQRQEGDRNIQGLLNSPDEPAYKAPESASTNMNLAPLGQAIAKMRQPSDNAKAPEWMPESSATYAEGVGDMAAPQINFASQAAPVLDRGGVIPKRGNMIQKRIQNGLLRVMDAGGPVGEDAPVPSPEEALSDGQHQLIIAKQGEVIQPAPEDRNRMPVMRVPNDSDMRGTDASHPPAQQSRDESFSQQPIPEPSPQISTQKGTDAERAALKTDKQQALGQGFAGLPKLGLAKIHENNLEEVPVAAGSMGQGTVAPQIAGTPDVQKPGYKPMTFHGSEEPTPAPQAPQIPTMSRKEKLADYDRRIQQFRDQGDLQGNLNAELLTRAKQSFIQSTPWGSPGSSHPGVGGRIGHIASEIAQGVGDVVAPRSMMMIPGTDLNRQYQEAGTMGRIKKFSELNTAEGNEEAKAGKTAQPKLLPGVENTAIGPDGTRYARYEMPGGSVQWSKEGQVPQAPQAAPQIGKAAASPAATPTVGMPKMTVAAPQMGDAGSMQGGSMAGLPAGATIGKTADKADTKEQRLARMAELNSAALTRDLSPAEKTEQGNLKSEFLLPETDRNNFNAAIDKSLDASGFKGSKDIYHIPEGSTPEEAKSYMSDAKAEAGQAWQGQAEERKIQDEDRKQVAKDKAMTGYAEGADGQTLMVTQNDVNEAAKNGGVIPSGSMKGTKLAEGGGFEEMKATEIAKDRGLVRVLSDVQKNITTYDTELKKLEANPSSISDTDHQKMQEITALQEAAPGAFSVGSHGISINNVAPVTAAGVTAGALNKASEDLANMSDNARRLLTAQLRLQGSTIAYQKALTGSARANETQLNLELANIPSAYWDTKTQRSRLNGFQDNVRITSQGYPTNLPGMSYLSKSQEKATYTPPNPADVVNSGTYKSQQVHKLRDGSVVDNNGKPVEVK